MRKPNLRDVFKGVRIAKKLGIKDLEFDPQKSVEDVGKDLIMFLLEHIDKIEDDLYDLVAGITEKTVDEIADMAIDELTHLIDELMRLEGMSDFFTHVSNMRKHIS